MLEQLEKISELYDLFALCSVYILERIQNEEYEFYNFEDEKYENVETAIEQYICDRENKGTRLAFHDLKNFVCKFLEEEIGIERCYAIVKYIDEKIEISIEERLLCGDGVIKYSSLNKNYTDKVRILPKMRDTIMLRGQRRFFRDRGNKFQLFRDRRENPVSKLDETMSNYMIWDEAKIEKYPISICHFSHRHPMTKKLMEKEQITFAIFPFSSRGIDEILDIKYDSRMFYIEKMYEDIEKEFNTRYIESRKNCKDVDFIIYPEMLMTEKIISYIDTEENMDGTQIIVNGSIWSDYSNKSIVTDGKGKEYITYFKKNPFIYNDKGIEYKEYLKYHNNKEFVIIEIESIGRIGIAICKDIINEDVKMFHKYMNTDILLVPSYTNSMDLQSAAEELSMDYHSLVFIVNACSAIGAKKQIGFFTLPAKSGSTRTRIVKYYSKNECISKCEQKCIGKKIMIDFGHVKEYEGLNSYVFEEGVIK